MDYDRAMRVFKQYCWNYKRSPEEAESLLLTDEERRVIRELKSIIKEYSTLFGCDDALPAAKAA